MSKTKAPSHPGEILRTQYLEPLGVNVTAAAEALGVSRKHVSAIVNERAPVTPDMAVRLAAAFGTEPELWLETQARFDLWTVRRGPRPRVRRLAT